MRTPDDRPEHYRAAPPATRPVSASILFVAGALAAAILTLAVLAFARWCFASGAGGLVPPDGLSSFVWTLVAVLIFPIGASGLSGLSPRLAYRLGLLLGRAAGAAVLVWWCITDGPIGTLIRTMAVPYARVFARLQGPDLATTAAMMLLLTTSGAGIGFVWSAVRGDATGVAAYATLGLVLVALFVSLLALTA